MRKGVNKKNLLTCIASLLLCFVCALFINGGVYLFNQNNNSSGGNHEPIKILTIDNSFEGSQYVVANGNVYEYLASEPQNNNNQQVSATLQSLNPTISLTLDKTFQLIFLKDTVNMLSAYTVENNISSIFTVEKQNDDISIALEYPNGNARAIFSSNSQYVLGSLALNVNTSLKFANGEFMVGETKNSTSFATTATTGNDAMILHLIEGHFSLIGDVSYSPAENENGRAIWVEGGELTVEDATFTNFDNDLSGSVLLNSGKATLTNVNMIENTGSTELISNGGELQVNGGEYSDNTLTFGGGGGVITNGYSNGPLHINGNASVTDVTFENNSAIADSYVIKEATAGSSTIIDGCEFNNNTVYAVVWNSEIKNSTFNLSGNTMGVYGVSKISNTTFNNSGTGACIYSWGNVILNEGVIVNSSADYGIIIDDENGNVILNSQPTISADKSDIYLGKNNYVTVNTTLTAPLSVHKEELTCYDEDTSNSSIIAYSTDNFNLASAEEYIKVVQYQDHNQHSMTLKDDYLVCEYKSYTATFDGNGGSNGASITTKYTFELGTLPTSSRVGYTLDGWFTEKDGGTQISSTTTMPANDVTYYAQWTAIKYDVKFNGNSSTSGSMSNQTFTYDVSQALTANAFKRAYVVTLNTNGGTCSTSSLTANYTFAGWATSASGEVVYADKASVKNLRNTAGTYNLYAKWTSASVTLPTPTKTGYTFNGWNTAENGTGTNYAAGASYTPSTTTTLYAQWTAIKYEVKFNGNSSTSGSMSNQTFTYDVSQALTANAFKRAYVVTLNTNGGTCSTSSLTANYTFAGWATSASGEVVYADKASVKNLRNTAGTYNLYAKWTSASVTLPTPTKTGYTFNGWNTAENGTGTSYAAGASYTPSTATTLYAQWQAIEYEVKFNGNSSTSGSMSNQTFTYDVSQALTANAFKRAYVVTLNANGGTCSTNSLTANYTFAGWATSASGDVAYADKASVKNLRNTAGTYNLYAKWTSASVTLPTPTKTGYTFNGWNTAENGTGTSFAAGENYTPVAAITLYAQWTINKYSVSIVASNADYGSVSVSTVANVPYGTTIKVGASTNILLVNGTEVIASSTDNTAQYTYKFSKWTQGSTSGTVVSTTGVTVTGAVTIYANFTRELNSYKVTIEPSPSGYGSVSSTSVVSVPYGTSITANGATLTIHTSSATSVSATAGDTTAQYTYAFSKWTQDSTSGAQVTSSGFTVSGAVTIYANFTRTLRSYAVNILIGQSGYGGVSSATVASVPYGTSITASGAVLTIHTASETTITATPTTATAQYTYSFNKWTQNSANGTQINSTGFNTTGETTIYANFGRTLNTYNVNIVVSPSEYGSVNVETIENVPYGSTVKVGTSANLLSVNGTVVTATATSKTGYTRTFSKWAKNSASGTQVTTTGFTTAGEETVYAIFSQSANTYTIAYDYAGGTKGSNAPANGTYDNGITISNPTRTGYTFTGWTASGLSTSTAKYGTSNSAINSAWSDEETKVTAIYFKNLRTTSGTVTLTANWSAVSYKIAFAGGGATGGSTADQTLTYDVATALTANGFTRAYKVTFNANGGTCGTSSITANYLFAGWKSSVAAGTYGSTSSACTTAVTTSAIIGNKYYVKNLAVNGTVTFTAQWNSASVTLPTPARTGYTFNGWNTALDGSGTSYASGASYTPSAATTLYAQWTANTYTIKFNGNGATGGSTADQTITYDVATALTANGFTRAYKVTFNANSGTCSTSSLTATYSFNGWKSSVATGTYGSTSAACTTAVTTSAVINNKYYVKNLAASGNVTFTAQWTSASVTLPTPTRTGYTFNGWYTAATDGTMVGGAGESYTPSAATTLYAQWTINTYTVTLTKDSGISSVSGAGTYTYGETVTLGATAATGYLFSKWTGYAESTTNAYSFKMPAQNVTLKANSSAQTYTITYAANNGTLTGTAGTDYTKTYNITSAITLPTTTYISRTGYTFGGWKVTTAGGNWKTTDSAYSESVAAGKYGNVTLTAQWTAIQYAIKFNGNGATSGSMSNQTHTYDASLALTANAFKRAYVVTFNANGGTCGTSSLTANYTFAGWATSTGGSVAYEDKESVKNLRNTAGTYNLYAKWTSASVALPTPTRTGYTFNGWNTAQNGSGTSYNAGASYTPTAAITLYAQWTANQYTITWNGNATAGDLILSELWNYAGSAGYTSSNTGSNSSYTEKSGVTAKSKVTYDSAASYKTPIPIRRGYSFNGWYTAATNGTKIADNAGNFIASVSGYTGSSKQWIKAANTTLYAQYTVNTYDITIDNAGGSGPSDTTYNTASGATIAAPTRTGYTFNGWNVVVSLNKMNNATISISDGTQQYSASYPDAVYYELFYIKSNISYTGVKGNGNIRWITYNATTGEFIGNACSDVTFTGNDTNLAFWYHAGNSSATTTISFIVGTGEFKTSDYKLTGDVALTARWSINKYTVSIVVGQSGYGSVSTTSIANVPYNSTIKVGSSANILSVNGTNVTATATAQTAQYSYAFSKWTQSSATGTQVTTTGFKVTGAITIYANFTRSTRTYTVTIAVGQSGYGTVSSSSVTAVPYGTKISASGATLTIAKSTAATVTATVTAATGYTTTFSKWTQSSTTGTQVTSTGFTITGAITIYANFTRTINKYSVTFHPNGGYRVSDTNYDAVTIEYDYGHKENISERRRTGYTLIGYTITDTSGGSAIGGATCTFDSTKKTGTVTVGTANIIVYMKWSPNIYKVTLDNQGATTAGTTEYYYQYNTTQTINNVVCYYYTTAACTTGLKNGYYITCPTKTGYTFGGYYTSTGGSGTQYVNASGSCVGNLYKAMAQNITLYAKWTINTYTITIAVGQSGYGTVSTSSVTAVPYGTTIKVGSSANILSVNGTNVTATATAATAQYSYAFSKWTQSNTTGTQVTTSGFTVTGTITIYANFTRTTNTYTVTIAVGQSGYGTVSSSSVTAVPYGTKITASGGTLTIAKSTAVTVTATATAQTAQYSYAFSKWTQSSTTGTQITSTGFTVTGAITIYANFTRSTRTYTVTIAVGQSGYGTVSSTSVTAVPYGTKISASGGTLTIAKSTAATVTATATAQTAQYSYAFSKWTQSSTSGTQVTSTGFTVSGNVTIYANFTRTTRTYTVSFAVNNANYGVVSQASITGVPYNSAITVSGNTVKINGTTVTASLPTTGNYWSQFSNWSNTSNTITAARTITANFTGKAAGLYSDASHTTLKTAWSSLVGNGVTVSDNAIIGSDYEVLNAYLVIPTSIIAIDEYAFDGCCDLLGVLMPDSMTSWGADAFYCCCAMTSVTIPAGITTISDYAFEECSALSSVTIHNKVTTIGIGAFMNCYNLTSITIPNSVTTIETSAFSYCALTSVTIPSSVTTLGGLAFGWNNLTSVNIPSSVTSIEYNPFVGNSNLATITSSSSTYTAVNNTLLHPSSKTIVAGCKNSVLPTSGYTTIGASAFRSCTGLTGTLTIPATITTIGNYAFNGCSGLTGALAIPSSVKSIGSSAFGSCRNITSITIPTSVTSIGSGAFGGCNAVQTLTYNASVTTAFTSSTCAFANLGSSSSTGGCTITIGGTVSAIPAYLFYGSSTSSYVHVKSLTIGSNITSIGAYAFRYATKLTSLSLPSSVTTIGSYAFYGCSKITTVTAQGALTSIGSYAFTGCSSIANYYLYNCTKVPTLGNTCMVGTTSKKIYVPRTLYSSWRSATNWSSYSSYIYWSDMINYSCYYTNSDGTYIEINGSTRYSGTGSFRYYSNQSFVVHSLGVDGCLVDDAFNTTYGLCVKVGSTCYHEGNDSEEDSDVSYTVSASSLLNSNTVVACNFTDYETSQTHYDSSGFISQLYHVNILAGFSSMGYGTVDGTTGISLYLLAGTTFTTTNTSKRAGGTIKINGKTYTATPTANNSTYVYYFNGWSVTSGTIEDLPIMPVTGHRTLTANFARYDAIEVQFKSAHLSGSVTPSVLYVAPGTTVTSQSTSYLRFNDGQSARATSGNISWEFSSWTRTSIATGSTTSGAITEPTLFTAHFARSSGTITPITPLASTQFEPPLEGIDNTATTLATCSMADEETEVETDAQEVWLDDKFRKLQEQQSTEVDFDGITFGA